MFYRPYGRTGKKISVIGAGTMRFETPRTEQDVRAAARVLLYAYEQGVNYFDTAPLYCGDRSEEITARALREMTPGTVYVSTKSSRADGKELRLQLERSLRRLRLDRIHFFHIWCVLRPEEWRQRVEGGAVAAALRAREEGLVEHVVLSTHMSGEETAAVIREGVVEGITLGYNVLNFPYRQAALRAAAEAGIGVVCMNPLAGGLIPAHANRFRFLRHAGEPDAVTAALHFLFAEPAVTSALVGFSRREEVTAAMRAVRSFPPSGGAEREQWKKHWEEGFDQLCTGCQYCLPCPAGVPIPKYMDVYNMHLLAEDKTAVLERLKFHWALSPKGARDCTACGRCEARCTQHLPIIERLKHVGGLQA